MRWMISTTQLLASLAVCLAVFHSLPAHADEGIVYYSCEQFARKRVTNRTEAALIKVSMASYGEGCPTSQTNFQGNATANVASECNGKNRCDFLVNARYGDPSPGCAKAFSVSWTCNNMQHTARHPAVVNEGYTVTLECPRASESPALENRRTFIHSNIFSVPAGTNDLGVRNRFFDYAKAKYGAAYEVEVGQTFCAYSPARDRALAARDAKIAQERDRREQLVLDEGFTFGEPGTKELPGTSCRMLHDQAGITRSGVYWLKPSATSQARQAWCEMTMAGGGWMLVARLAGSGAFPTWNFDLQPNHSAGTYVADPSVDANFYREWNEYAYSQLLLTTTNKAVWLVTDRSNFQSTYANDPRTVVASSASAKPTTYRWYFRGAVNPEDPWVSVGDHIGQILYGENGYGNEPHTTTKNHNGGVGIYVR